MAKPPQTVEIRNHYILPTKPAQGDVLVFRANNWTPEPMSGGGGAVVLHAAASRYVSDAVWTVVGAVQIDGGGGEFVVGGWTEGADLEVALYDLTNSAELSKLTIDSVQTTFKKSGALTFLTGPVTLEVRTRCADVGFVAAAYLEMN